LSSRDCAKIGDFGLSRPGNDLLRHNQLQLLLQQEEDTRRQHPSPSNVGIPDIAPVVGTKLYMAPEINSGTSNFFS